jgi:2-polyprenyl-3-methyl-5-hydroxy-6-metoxy-1,4-benzoquinol methylase
MTVSQTPPAISPTAQFWDKVADRYAARAVGDEGAYREKLRLTQAVLGPDAQVLEFGCGTGSVGVEHAPHVARYLATDISGAMIELARGRAAGAGLKNLECRVATLEDLSAEGAAWDAVLGLNILHLLKDPDAAIAQAFAMVKPGGVFITSTGTLKDGLGWVRPLIWAMRQIGKAPFVKFLSEAELIASMKRAGFEVETVWRPKKRASLFVIARKPG